MAKAGQNKDNKNAALKPGERGRIQWTQGLSGNDLLKALDRLGIQDLNDTEARRALRKKSEELLKAWLTDIKA